MENKNAISEMINQVKQFEENMSASQEYTNSMTMLVNSNDLAQPKDKALSEKINKLNNQVEDINKLTSDLLEELNSRHN